MSYNQISIWDIVSRRLGPSDVPQEVLDLLASIEDSFLSRYFDQVGIYHEYEVLEHLKLASAVASNPEKYIDDLLDEIFLADRKQEYLEKLAMISKEMAIAGLLHDIEKLVEVPNNSDETNSSGQRELITSQIFEKGLIDSQKQELIESILAVYNLFDQAITELWTSGGEIDSEGVIKSANKVCKGIEESPRIETIIAGAIIMLADNYAQGKPQNYIREEFLAHQYINFLIISIVVKSYIYE